MTNMVGSSSVAKPSSGYLISLALACAGLPFMGIALGSALRARAGGDPMRALQVDGVVLFILAFLVGYSIRLIFWPPVPPALRSLTRAVVSIILALGLLSTLVSVLLAWQLPPTAKYVFVPHIFSVFAALCQTATVIWLVKYRNEGL